MYLIPPWGLDTRLPPILVSDNDLFITNTTGTPGPMGPTGPAGPSGSINPLTAIGVVNDYQIQESDYYIGVSPTNPVTLTLPRAPRNGTWVIIKLEIGAPIGSRKAIITTSDASLIDGVTSKTLQHPYECIQLIYANQQWNKIT